MPTPAVWNAIAVVAIACASSIALTAIVRAVARRVGAVAAPRQDRWHKKPTAMFGGIAIFLAVIVTILIFVPLSKDRQLVLIASTLLFFVGLADDIITMKPYQKLIGQIAGAGLIVYYGLLLPWTSSLGLNVVITMFWLIGVTNAVNMLDNMDGLAAGVAAIAGGFLGLAFAFNGQIAEALMCATFAAALVGFLAFNHNPASIFMGDCGSMFIGFFLATSALLAGMAGGGRSKTVFAVLAVPVLVLCIPIFDTTFVTLTRKLAGRAASRGGRDHTSHRLVALGLSEKKAVWMLYAFALSGGTLALAARNFTMDVSIAMIGTFVIVLTLIGVHLARVRVYAEEELAAAREKPVVGFLIDLSYKRRVFEVFLDGALISLSYYVANAIVFGPMRASAEWAFFIKTLPVIVVVKLAAFLIGGVYRGLWKYMGVSDVATFARGALLASLMMVLLFTFAFQLAAFSRRVVVIDCILLTILVTGSRFAFRLLRRLIGPQHARTARRVLIFGAGDGGELVWRELANNAQLSRIVVGFVDDDWKKSGKLLHGIRVYSTDTPFAEICSRTEADELILSTQRITPARLQEVVSDCQKIGVPVKRMRIAVERVADMELGWVLPSTAVGTDQSVASMPIEAPLIHASPRTLNTEH